LMFEMILNKISTIIFCIINDILWLMTLNFSFLRWE
jgi:hypothetical protein